MAKAEIVRNTQDMMRRATKGLADATGPDPGRRRDGVMDLFVFGRSTTLAMEKMKSLDPGYKAWREPYEARFASDPLMSFFSKTRTDIIHQGELTMTNHVVSQRRL